MEHITHLLSDYVLDLLPAEARGQVERHAAACSRCRQQLQRERQLTHLVRETMLAAGHITPLRLVQLRPPLRQRHQPWFTRQSWQKGVAVMAVCLFLFVASLSLHPTYNAHWQNGAVPSVIAATATITPLPATATQTAAPSPTSTTPPQQTPGAAATPVAFLWPR